MHPFLNCCSRILLAICIASPCVPGFANSPRTLHFGHLGIDQGIAHEPITTIMQDKLGFMWFGSQNGLSRYDGYRVTVYKNIRSDIESLADNWIQALYVDDKGRLWIGTRAGLQRFNPATESFTRFIPQESATFDVGAIAADGHGKLWLVTSGGLQHFNPETGEFISFRPDLNDWNTMNSNAIVALSANGDLWIGGKNGIDRLSSGKNQFERFRFEDNVAAEYAQLASGSLIIDREQSLWVVTSKGLETWRLEGGHLSKRRYGTAEGLLPGMILALYEDRDGTIWIGTQANGLYRWDATNNRFVRYHTEPSSIAGKEVSALYQDRTGTLWIGTWTAGLKYVDLASGGFSHYFHVPGDDKSLSDNRVYGIESAGPDSLWLGVFGGLNRLNVVTGEISIFRGKNTAGVFRDQYKQLWVGTDTGLGRFDAATGLFKARLFQTGDTYSDSITHIADDSSGKLWVASRGGLHHLDPVTNTVKTYRHDSANPNSLVDNWVKRTLRDKRGIFWIATDNGLDRLDPVTGIFSHLRHDSNDSTSLNGNRVQYLYEDKKEPYGLQRTRD